MPLIVGSSEVVIRAREFTRRRPVGGMEGRKRGIDVMSSQRWGSSLGTGTVQRLNRVNSIHIDGLANRKIIHIRKE
jgi:hypothetical protein